MLTRHCGCRAEEWAVILDLQGTNAARLGEGAPNTSSEGSLVTFHQGSKARHACVFVSPCVSVDLPF